MHIIIFFQLNMCAWLHKAGFPGHPKALLAQSPWLRVLDTYPSQSLATHCSAHRTRVGVRQLLTIGMRNPDKADIIRNNSKNNRYNSNMIVKWNDVMQCNSKNNRYISNMKVKQYNEIILVCCDRNHDSLLCWRTRLARASRCPGSESAKMY